MTADLSQMYLHLSLAPNERTNFGFAITNETGQEEFYHFNVLPFGLSTSTHIMEELMIPISYYLHESSIDFSIYIDDSATVAKSWIKSWYSYMFILHVFGCGGWQVNFQKSCKQPMRKLIYLGFQLSTLDMRISAPFLKLVKIDKAIQELLQVNRQKGSVPIKGLAQILGGVCHLLVSHGSIMRLATRTCQHCGGLAVSQDGWTGFLKITVMMEKELRFVTEVLYKYNDNPIKWDTLEVTVVKPDKQTIYLDQVDPELCKKERIVIISDASETSSYFYTTDTFELVKEFGHSPDEQKQSSSFRELLSIYKFCINEKEYLEKQRNKMIVWGTDSQVNKYVE